MSLLELLATRRKALVAIPVPLVGGILALYPDSRGLQILAIIVTAIATAFGVHQVPNAPGRDDG